MWKISIAIALGAITAKPVSAASYADDYWKSADVLTKRFICSTYGETPDWCAELPGRVEVPKSIAVALTRRQESAADQAARAKQAARKIAEREAIVKRIQAGRIAGKDVESLVEQAKGGETAAMEIMAWMYAQGLSPNAGGSLELNELAYIWYGRAYLAGATEVKVNMDKIWPSLSETQQRRIVALFDREK